MATNLPLPAPSTTSSSASGASSSINSHDGLPRTNQLQVSSDTLQVGTERGVTVTRLVTPRVTSVARDIFGCDTLAGAELEQVARDKQVAVEREPHAVAHDQIGGARFVRVRRAVQVVVTCDGAHPQVDPPADLGHAQPLGAGLDVRADHREE